MDDTTATELLLEEAIAFLRANPPDIDEAKVRVQHAFDALIYPDFELETQQLIDAFEKGKLTDLIARATRLAARIKQSRESIAPPALADPDVTGSTNYSSANKPPENALDATVMDEITEDGDAVAADWFNLGYFVRTPGRTRRQAIAARLEQFGQEVTLRQMLKDATIVFALAVTLVLMVVATSWGVREYYHWKHEDPPLLADLMPPVSHWWRITVEGPDPLPPVDIAGTIPCKGPGIVHFEDEVLVPMRRMHGGHVTVYEIEAALQCGSHEDKQDVWIYSDGLREGQAIDIACLWEKLEHCPSVNNI